MAGRPPSSCRRDGGFALIIVLWTLVLIGFIVVHLTASGRTEIRIANNLVANSIAEAAADGAIFEAIFNLSDPRPDHRWPVDGVAREVSAGASRVMVRVEDEAWGSSSSASPELLEALLRVTGSDPEAHVVWHRDQRMGRLRTSPGAERAPCGISRGGARLRPPGGPLES
jgi:general secretion pathway protein K